MPVCLVSQTGQSEPRIAVAGVLYTVGGDSCKAESQGEVDLKCAGSASVYLQKHIGGQEKRSAVVSRLAALMLSFLTESAPPVTLFIDDAIAP